MKFTNQHRVVVCAALSLAAAFTLNACNDTTEFEGSPYDTTNRVCQNDTFQCTDNNLYICEKYNWKLKVECSDNQTCDVDQHQCIANPIKINTEEQWIGAPCECVGSDEFPCKVLGKIPIPTGYPISGCDNMPDVEGARRVCQTTISKELSTMAPWTYFPAGYCTLGAVSCEGNDVCSLAAYGDVDSFNSCPAGSALLKGDFEYDLLGSYAHLRSRTCAKLCETDSDCNTDGDIHCIERTGVKFCYNEQNFEATGEPTVVAFY